MLNQPKKLALATIAFNKLDLPIVKLEKLDALELAISKDLSDLSTASGSGSASPLPLNGVKYTPHLANKDHKTTEKIKPPKTQSSTQKLPKREKQAKGAAKKDEGAILMESSINKSDAMDIK